MKALLASAILAGACGGATDPAGDGQVRFAIEGTACPDPHPVNFFIDNVQVGRDTLWFAGDPDASPTPVRFKAYRSFSVRAGFHTLSATLVDTILPNRPALVYSWPDTTVNVVTGAEVVRKLPFYCS